MEKATRNKLAELFFEIKERIPDGKYIEFMNILGKIEKARDFKDVKYVKLKYRFMCVPRPSPNMDINNLDIHERIAILQVVPFHDDDDDFERCFVERNRHSCEVNDFYNHQKFLDETAEISQKKLHIMDGFTKKTCSCPECKLMRMPNNLEIIEPLCIEIVA